MRLVTNNMDSTYSWFGSSSSCPNTWSGYTYRPLCMMHFEVSGCERILMRGYDKAILWPDVVSKWALCANKHTTLSLPPSLSTGSRGDGHGQARMPVIGNGKYINILGACA